MWDVKANFLVKLARSHYWFYLNYVGCKASSSSGTGESWISFTLTMWDVKFLLLYSLEEFINVLP